MKTDKAREAASKPKRGTPCGACGGTLRTADAVRAYVATFDVLDPRFVCAECARRGILVVMPAPAERARDVLRPFAAFIRRLAKPYELNGDARAVGLNQAADVLESGRAVAIESSNGAHVEPLAGAAVDKTDLARLADIAPLRRFQVGAEDRAAAKKTGHLTIEALDKTPAKPAPPAAAPKGDAGELGGCEMALLAVLLRARLPVTRVVLGLRAGYSVTSGGYSAALGRLRAKHLIEGPASAIRATSAGDDLARSASLESVNLPAELVGYWAEKVGGAAGTILTTAAAAYPGELSRLELAERAGYRATSGGYSAALGKLRSLHLLDGCRASDALMMAACQPPHP